LYRVEDNFKHAGEPQPRILKDEYVVIHNTPVQFLIPYNPLIDAALKNCIEVIYADTKVHIFSLEYMMTIMIETGTGKDKAGFDL
jgi:hypothetical protein